MLSKFKTDLRNEFCGYNLKGLSKDAMAGLTVAAVALPLALAFGVSSGADAASGLITAIIAGLMIGALSGASYQISGPTGAMSAILLSISAKYGIQGVLTAGLLSGVLLLVAAAFKTGKLVSYIPAPVITGFTSGIAIIIALGQIDNFFGTSSAGESAIHKLISYGSLGFSPNWQAVLFGALVVLIMVLYPKKLNGIVPSSLVSIIAVLILNMVINPQGGAVAEVGAIPQRLMTDHSLLKTGVSWNNLSDLLLPALSIAALGMIESLLCGASAGKMKGERLDAQRELVAQGIGNIIIPLFGGVPATAAIARTSVAIKSGGQTRLTSVFHSIVLILSMFLLGNIMSRIPLSALAGVLMVTAWRMNEWDSIRQIFKCGFKSSIAQFLITMVATVVFDLTMAIAIGVVMAMFLFVVKSCELDIVISNVDAKRLSRHNIKGDHSGTKLAYLSGPLFFGTQEQLTHAVEQLPIRELEVMIFSMRGVPMIDDSAVHQLCEIVTDLRAHEVQVLFCGVQPHVHDVMERAGFIDFLGEEFLFWDAVAAIKQVEASVVMA